MKRSQRALESVHEEEGGVRKNREGSWNGQIGTNPLTNQGIDISGLT